MKRPPAFILGDYLGSLGVIQSLGAKGVPCWVCAPEKKVAARSRFARFWSLPAPHEGLDGIVERLRELRQRTGGGRPVLIPADEPYAAALARLSPELDADFAVCGGPLEAIELLSDKRRFAEWSAEHGVPCLPSLRASDVVEPEAFPIVVKPIDKFTFRYLAKDLPAGTDSSTYDFTLIEDAAEWHAFREALHANLDNLIVQPFVSGTTADMYSVGVYANSQSQILGTLVFRKIRGYPAQSGETKAGQNDQVPPAILLQVEQVVKALNYRGIVEFEYRRSATTGEFHLLDVNPRAWTWIAISVASTADIPWIAYQDLCGIPLESAVETRPSGTIKYVFLTSDLLSVLFRYREDHPDWSISLRQWWQSLEADTLVIAEVNQWDWSAGAYFGWKLLGNIWERLTQSASALRQRSVTR